jgi:glycogen synthase
MKILLVGNYPPPFGGMSVHLQLLHRLLLRRGIDCRVLNVDPRAEINQNYIFIRGYLDFIIQLILAGRGRIIHMHASGRNPKSWLIAMACAWIGYLFGCGSILTIHSGLAPNYIRKSRFIQRVIIRSVLVPQSLVICVNEQIRDAIIELGYSAGKTFLLPAFLFDEQETAKLDEGRKKELSRFTPLLSLTVFFRPEYGVELLIQALGMLAEKFPHIGCAIMGSGAGEERLKQLAAESGVADRLIWLGDLKHSECLSIVKLSNLFVRPTLADGDSLSVREALMLGIPVVASNVGHRPASALLFKCGDAADLATNCATALENPRELPQQQSWIGDNFLISLIDTYNQIWSGDRPQREVVIIRS